MLISNYFLLFVFLIVIFFFLFILKIQPFKFKNINYSELDKYMYLLLLRGYSNSNYPNGVLFIVSKLDGRWIMLRKYNIRNKIGLNLYFPIYNRMIKLKIDEYFERNVINKKKWIDKIPEIDIDVIGINLLQDIDCGVKLIKFLSKYIFPKEGTNSKVSELYFLSVEDKQNTFIDFNEKDVDSICKNDLKMKKYINIPLTFYGRITMFIKMR